jgi:hypothetical protein
MFDLKLTDVFSTLCIGILTLSLITYFYFIVNKFFVKGKFDGDIFIQWIKDILKGSYKESGYLVLALVVVYCLGVVAGDLTGRMTDSDSSHKSWLLRKLKVVSKMPSQENNRIETIVEAGNGWKLSGLGGSVLRSPSIVKNANLISGTSFLQDSTCTFNENWDILRLQLVADSLSETGVRRNFAIFLQQIYYTGKNWCFSKDHEPLNELKAIQNRIDLSRSMVLLMTLSIGVLLLVVILNLFYVVIIQQVKEQKTWKFWQNGKFQNKFNLLQSGAFVIFIVIFLVSKECYQINQDSYNKRAYGYYVSEVNRIEYLKGFPKKVTVKTDEESDPKGD